MMARWHLRAQLLLWRWGWAWPCACLFLLASLALAQHAHRIETHNARLEAALPSAELARSWPPANPEPAQLALPAEIAAAPDVTATVARMLALAQAAGIELAQAEYQQTAHPSLQMRQTQVTQPLRATYPQLRRYLESVLRELPHASLDHLSARRDAVAHGQLDIRLQWSLWSAATPGKPS